jgi:hypothetical protein
VKRALGACGVLVLLTLVTACSGGSSGPTKAEFVRKANAVCRDGAAKIARLKIPARADVTNMPAAAADVVAVQRRSLARLRALAVPKRDKAQVEKWIAIVDQTIDQAQVSAQSQRDGDIARALAANLNGAALDRRADDLARRYGLVTCVQASTAPPTTTTTKAGS